MSGQQALPTVTQREKWREKIQASQLLNRLRDHAMDGEKVKMTATQVKAAEILLRKVIPDLKAIEHSGEVNLHKLTDAELDAQITEAAARMGFVRKEGP